MVSSVSETSSTAYAQVWEKTSTDIYDESVSNARDIGQIRLNYSRLSVITTLSKNEKEDWFKFNVVSRGNLRLSAVNLSAKDEKTEQSTTSSDATEALEDAKNDYQAAIDSFKGKGLRVEVYTFVNNRQTLVATNDESEKKEYEAFEKLMRGEYEVPNSQKGWYYVHVTTEDGDPVDDDTLYALQLQMGDTYKHDYLTQEQSIDHTKVTEGDIALAKAEEAMGGVTPSASILSAQGASSILSAGYTNMATIQSMQGKDKTSQLFNLLI